MKLKDITKPAVIVSLNTTFKDALSVMVAEQTNSLLVTGEDGTFVGEVGVSELLSAVVPEYLDDDNIAAHFTTEEMFEEAVHDASTKTVSEFMTNDVEPIRSDDNLMTVASMAITAGRARIPVVDNENRPIGIISRRGLKHILAHTLEIPDSA